MIRVGLTGSIGMGKSTTARMFADLGAAVFDADASVHALYAPGGAATETVARRFGDVLDASGGVDRARLRMVLGRTPTGFADLEAIVHPLVRGQRRLFDRRARRAGRAVVVHDIPLLFETGAESDFDCVVVVSAPLETQRARVLARPGMTEAMFEGILARQWPDDRKRAHADHLIDTGGGLSFTRAQVRAVMRRWRLGRGCARGSTRGRTR